MKNRVFYLVAAFSLAVLMLSTLATVLASEKQTAEPPNPRQAVDYAARMAAVPMAATQETLIVTKTVTPPTATMGTLLMYTIELFNAYSISLTNLVVADSLPSCVLAPPVATEIDSGTSQTYSCSITAGVTDITNTVIVTSQHAVSGTIVVTDTAFVDIINPSLAITKTADPLTTTEGSPITYTVDVFNDGDVKLTGLLIQDDQCTLNTPGTTVISPGLSLSYDCTVLAGTVDVTNTVTVTASNPIGELITKTATAFVDIVRPSLVVTKTAEPPTTTEGSLIVYTVDVFNDGDVALTGLSASDDQCELNPPATSVITPGLTLSYDCLVVASSIDMTNTAVVSATDPTGGVITRSATAFVDIIRASLVVTKTADPPTTTEGGPITYTVELFNDGDVSLSELAVVDDQCALSGPADPVIGSGNTFNYQCTIIAGTADITNTVRVTGTSPINTLITDTDSAVVNVIRQSLVVTKTADPLTTTDGSPITYTVEVFNDGDVPLSDLAVTDDQCALSGPAETVITAGDTFSYECAVIAGSIDVTNTVRVTGTSPINTLITRTASAFVDIIRPSLVVTKTAEPLTTTESSPITYTVEVFNDGNVPLSDLTVVDDQCALSGPAETVITAGDTFNYQCTVFSGSTDITNTVFVTGTDPSGGIITRTASVFVDIIRPSLVVTKAAEPLTTTEGSSITYTVELFNDGDVPLSELAIIDDQCALNGPAETVITAGSTFTYDCLVVAGGVDVTNTVTVTATDPIGGKITRTASALVDIIRPSLIVTKTAESLTTTDESPITYTVEVFNDGDVPLSDLAVVDDQCILSGPADTVITAGDIFSYQCTVIAGNVDITNTVRVTGTSPINTSITDTDSAVVDVIRPSLIVTKTADPLTTTEGSPITYTVELFNDGDVPLSNLAVVDDQCVLSGPAESVITAGDTFNYQCTIIAGSVDITNTVRVTGTSPIDTFITGTDSAVVDVIRPSLVVTKTADPLTTTEGSPITYMVEVFNDGDVPLSDLAVIDDQCILSGAAETVITAGDTFSYECTVIASAVDITNTVRVTGTSPINTFITGTDSAVVDVIRPSLVVTKTAEPSVVTQGAAITYTVEVFNDGDVPLTDLAVVDDQCDLSGPAETVIAAGDTFNYQCSIVADSVDITNTVRVTSTSPINTSITDTDTAVVDVIRPSLVVTKTADPLTTTEGSPITYTVEVFNDGDVPLSNLAVIDDQCALSGPAKTVIAAGDSFNYQCSIASGSADITNTVRVTGTSPVNTFITDTDTAVVDVIRPSLVVTKTAEPSVVTQGTTITYTVEIFNDGDVSLAELAVTDDQCALSGPADTVITAGDIFSYQCSIVAGNIDITNSVRVTGTSPINTLVTDTDLAVVDVIRPSLVITKSPGNQYVVNGTAAQFTVVIENTGDVDLFEVVASDPQASGCNASISLLSPGIKLQSNCTVENVTADFSNQAAVTSFDPIGNSLSDSSTADVVVINPNIDISVVPQSQYVYSQGAAFFTVTVTNTGDVPLENVIVSDPDAASCDRNIGSLDANSESYSYACFRNNVITSFTNVATVTGTHFLGGSVADSDTAAVRVIVPTIAIEKLPDTQTIGSGGTATFSIYVTNTGNITLTNIVVEDMASPDCDFGPVTLSPQSGTGYSCSRFGATEDFLNTATVSGIDPLAGTVNDGDTGFVNVEQASVSIRKTAFPTTIVSGDTAQFFIQVSNPSDIVDLMNVVVTDTLAPDCNRNIPDTINTEPYEYSCLLANVTTAFTNLATAGGYNVNNGAPVSDSDAASIEVLELGVGLTVDPASQPEPGGTVSFAVVVTNSGSKKLTITSLNSVPYGDLTLLSGSSCSEGVEVVENGGIYACSFDREVAGQPAVTNITVTVTAEDSGGLEVSESASTNATITDVPSAIGVSLAADPTFLAEPGGDIFFNLRIDNNSLQDEVTIDSLNGGALLGNIDGQGSCSLSTTTTIPVNESYQCVFSKNVSGEPGMNLNFEVTASGTDDDGQPVSSSGQETVTIVNLPSSMAVTLTAEPGGVPEPGAEVSFAVRIDNTSQVDSIIIDSLAAGALGDLDGRGTCRASQLIPAGGFYRCTFVAEVSGSEGEVRTFTVTASATDDDGNSLLDNDQTTITILQLETQYVFLPVTMREYVVDEPNDTCSQAYMIRANQDYYFLPDDEQDWYLFNLPATGKLTVELTEFTPVLGQIVVYRTISGCDSGDLIFLKNNGDFSSTKIVSLGSQPAGNYYIRIINDGPFMGQPYKLYVRAP